MQHGRQGVDHVTRRRSREGKKVPTRSFETRNGYRNGRTDGGGVRGEGGCEGIARSEFKEEYIVCVAVGQGVGVEGAGLESQAVLVKGFSQQPFESLGFGVVERGFFGQLDVEADFGSERLDLAFWEAFGERGEEGVRRGRFAVVVDDFHGRE